MYIKIYLLHSYSISVNMMQIGLIYHEILQISFANEVVIKHLYLRIFPPIYYLINGKFRERNDRNDSTGEHFVYIIESSKS